ncbi:MAG TPA: amidase [Solirubrobacteraceae bacterium]|nr:amidase [Solirubrobacteraceae bacterium]
MSLAPYAELDAVGIARAVRGRECSAVEMARAALERIESLDGELGAFTVTLGESALAGAKGIDAAVASGDDVGPLAGVPVSIKDFVWMRGALATNGSLAFRDFVPEVDCVPVARIRAAGATIVGKTNNPEFCYRGYTDNALWGVTRNPWNRERTPGGSSGGAGASVAAGMTPLAIGTDGGGSVRIPASYCGLVGVKPTFGLVPKEPGFPGWKTLSIIGPLSRTVRDAALLLAVTSGVDPADDMSYPGGDRDFVAAAGAGSAEGLPVLRVAYSADGGFAAVDADVRRVFADAVERFAAGTGVAAAEAHPAVGDAIDLWGLISGAEGFASEGPLLAEHEAEMTPGTADMIRAGDVPAVTYIDAMHERGRYTTAWSEFFEEFDVLLSPTMQSTAFGLGLEGPQEIEGRRFAADDGAWASLVVAANLTGQPAVTVPCGFGDDGLPIGLQITTRRFEDALALRVAAAWEAVAPWPRLAPESALAR